MGKPVVVFDFDGTISDSFPYVFDFLWKEAKKSYQPESAEIKKYVHMHMKDMALKMGVPWWQLPKVYYKGRRQMRHKVAEVQPFDGMIEQVRLLHEQGFTLYILSASSRRTIHRFLQHHELTGYFRAIYAGAAPFGKEPKVRRLIRRQRLQHDVCWMVGDLATDAIAAKASGMKTVGVTWGFDSRESLERAADFVVDKPADISRVIMANTDTM